MNLTDYSNINNCNVKYLKLVNHTSSQGKKWSYYFYEINKEYDLHWAINENKKKDLSEEEIQKILKRKERDANKAFKGDRILLCQNNCSFGHRITHVVETVTSTAEWKDEIWTRLVQVVWVARQPWNKYAPETKDVIGNKFSFRNGNLISTNAPTIKLNINKLYRV